jgi:ATP-dependent Clp protease ATP-binding subunit ClpC
MMFNEAGFTDRARKVIHFAREAAARLRNDYVGTEHILLGLIREGEGMAANILLRLGVDLDAVRQRIEEITSETGGSFFLGDLPYNPGARQALQLAVDEAKALNHSYVGTEHLLLGLLREEDGTAAKILNAMGVDLDHVRQELAVSPDASAGEFPQQAAGKKSKTPALDFFCRDLTSLAKEGKLDPIIGRAQEIERVIQILSRRTKNNPVLIGEPGVGKTAIVEGLAQKIVQRSIPDLLRDRRVLALDLASVVAGTKYRGQFEERMKAVMNEIRQSSEIILFIDELHTIVGAGAAEGAIDASSMLKPALARGELQCVGATTMDEYRKHIEKDGALERRFQTIMVDPPTVPQAIEILRGLQSRYEAHHRVKYTDEAITQAVRLSNRYISDRYLPDKAIDVIDEAGSRARLSQPTVPPNLANIQNELEAVTREKDDAVTGQDFERAAALRDRGAGLKTRLEASKKEWEKRHTRDRVEVTAEDIAYVISRWTGIPLIKLEESESQKLLHMEDELRKRVVGQDEALLVISRAIRRARAGLKDPRRPTGSFIFLGPTGVGKTELARALAAYLFEDDSALVRIDMSEYMEKFAVSRLIGAPPGYVGYEEGGQLTEKVRRKPYSVVLFDEIEKAHPDVFHLLLQVLDDGVLTDSFGRKVSFKNTVVIMTSNIGARDIKKGVALGFQKAGAEATHEAMKAMVTTELKKVFNPEFLNRVDEVVVFHALGRPEMDQIIDILLGEFQTRLVEKKLTIGLTDEARELLVKEGFDPSYGARPLRRVIQRLLENPLSEEILAGKFKEGETIEVDRSEDHLTFRTRPPQAPKELATKATK